MARSSVGVDGLLDCSAGTTFDKLSRRVEPGERVPRLLSHLIDAAILFPQRL